MRNWLFLFTLLLLNQACFKNLVPNEKALIQQKSCIESIELKDYPRAKNHCELCLEYDRRMVECINGLGLIFMEGKDSKKAKDFFIQAIRQNNDYSHARNNLGAVYFSEGDFDKALTFFNKALEIDPGNLDARYNSGLTYFRLARGYKAKEYLSLALEQINKLLVIEPQFANAWRDLGLIYLKQYEITDFKKDNENLLQLAKNSFLECLKQEEGNDGCHEGLGLIFNKTGYFKEAFASYFQCISNAPENSACRNGIIEAYEKSIKEEESFRTFYKKPEDHDTFCSILFSRGLIKEAVQQCELALKLNPNICMPHFRLADHFATILDSQKALHYCQSFLSCSVEIKNLSEQIKCQEILMAIKRG